jgi:hypothetical protein
MNVIAIFGSQFRPRVSSIAKTDLARFCGFSAAGARSVANCGGAGTRAEVCGGAKGLLGGVTRGTSGFVLLATAGAIGPVS